MGSDDLRSERLRVAGQICISASMALSTGFADLLDHAERLLLANGSTDIARQVASDREALLDVVRRLKGSGEFIEELARR